MKIRTMCALAALFALSPAVFAHSPSYAADDTHTPRTTEQQPWGIAGDGNVTDRVVTVRMSDDMRFTPDGITVRNGETIRFIVHNDGATLHEMVIGTRETLDRHAELMMKFPGMAHDEPWMAHVDPGGSAQIVWTFNREGRFDFACLLPGHYQAGMLGRINVGTDRLAGIASGTSSDTN